MQQDTARYEFIMDKGAPRGGGGLSSSTKGRIMMVAIGAGILLMVAAILMSTVFKSKDTLTPQLTSLVQQQQEIIRVSAIGAKQAHSSAALNFALTTQLSMQADQARVINLLKTGKHKVSEGVLNAGKDVKTDQALNLANQNNSFDDAFTKELQTELKDYQTTLKSAYSIASSTTSKQVLSVLYAHVNTLLQDKSAAALTDTPTTN